MPHMRFAQPRNGLPVTLTVAPWLLHGWPGSFHEFGRAAELSPAPRNGLGLPGVPRSLPGYGDGILSRPAYPAPKLGLDAYPFLAGDRCG